jgi:hypothetical protein
MRSQVWIVIMLIASAVNAGCGGTAKLYEGEQQPKEKVATIVLAPALDLSSEPAKVRQIDGAAIDPMEDRAEVMPGKHTLAGEVSYRSSWPVKFSTSFEAEAGHTYEVIGSCGNQNDCTGTIRDVEPGS